LSSESSNGGNSSARSARPFLYANVGGGNENPVANAASSSPAAAQTQTDQRPHDQGQADAETIARAGFEKTLAELRSQITGALRQFTTQRETYFEGVETEIVQLSLSIARKILHREAQIDPLLLTGVVHVALERLNDGTQTRLRINPDEIRFWRDYFSQAHDIHPTPELIGDPSLGPGHCMLETDLGSTHISLETQLKEIEQGFLDLLEQRPRVQK
jgi:flagellar assembly protein FliH